MLLSLIRLPHCRTILLRRLLSSVAEERHAGELEKIVRLADLTSQGQPLRLLGLRDKKAHLSHDEWRRGLREVPEEWLEVMQLLREAVTDVASPQSRQLRGVAPATPPLCILLDMFVPWAQEAAEQLNMQLWTLDSPHSLKTFAEHSYYVYNTTWNPRHADIFASASGDCTLRVWDVRQPRSTYVISGQEMEVLSCDWN